MGDRVRGAWAELRRRRVVSTSAAYLAVAFVLLQLGEILFPAFDLGPGALRALFALLLAAFPIGLGFLHIFRSLYQPWRARNQPWRTPTTPPPLSSR